MIDAPAGRHAIADAFRYRAFISYSHADRAVAAWLHRALETLVIPRALVGRDTAHGPVPARLHPVFKDREELPASGDLSAELQAALAASRFLIVIASPAAARSRWVDAEIARFVAVHGQARVLALIADGEPGDSDRECFPPALRMAEPIAADLRPGGDGRRGALLKLAAGLTGLRLDDLVQRDAQRRARRTRAVAVAASLLALVMSGLALFAFDARRDAERRRGQAEGLVEYMLTDLRQKLEPVGRLEVLDGVGQRALAYYGEQEAGAMDADALGRRARAQLLIGEVTNLRGDSASALRAFAAAAAATGELLRREPDAAQRIYDHAQSVFWVGFIAWQRKDVPQAMTNFRAYVNLADRLVALDPANAQWQTEKASARMNLAILLDEQGRSAEAGRLFDTALGVEQQLVAMTPTDPVRLYSVGQAYAYVADNRARLSDLKAALESRRSEQASYARILAIDPRHAKARDGQVMAGLAIADLLIQQRQPALAMPELAASTDEISRLRQLDPDNQRWAELSVHAGNLRAEAAMLAGDLASAGRAAAQALAGARALVAADPSAARWRHGQLMPARAMEVHLARAARDPRVLDLAATFRRDFETDRFATPSARAAWLLGTGKVDRAELKRFARLATTPREKALVERHRAATLVKGSASPRGRRDPERIGVR